jgi:hypothetical protein
MPNETQLSRREVCEVPGSTKYRAGEGVMGDEGSNKGHGHFNGVHLDLSGLFRIVTLGSVL